MSLPRPVYAGSAADMTGAVDGSGGVHTIYGLTDTFPERLTRCLAGVAVPTSDTIHIVDSCAGFLIEVRREVP